MGGKTKRHQQRQQQHQQVIQGHQQQRQQLIQGHAPRKNKLLNLQTWGRLNARSVVPNAWQGNDFASIVEKNMSDKVYPSSQEKISTAKFNMYMKIHKIKKFVVIMFFKISRSLQ